MRIKNGQRLPAGRFRTTTPAGVESVSVDEVFGGKRVVLFAVPGAFTPTCSDSHLPGYLARIEEFEALGVDTVACLAVNDVFVMDAWRKMAGVERRLLMLADGSGEYMKKLGLELDLTAAGMGVRSQRFAAIVEDRVVQLLHVETGRGVDVSGADAMLAALGRQQ